MLPTAAGPADAAALMDSPAAPIVLIAKRRSPACATRLRQGLRKLG
jgi:hydrogenase maturation protein HypF